MHHTVMEGLTWPRLVPPAWALDGSYDQPKPDTGKALSRLRQWLVGVTTLLLLAGNSWAEEYKNARISKAAGNKVTLSWKEEKKTKTAIVYVGKDTTGTDAAGKDLKGQQLTKILQVGTLVDVTTEKVPARQAGLRSGGEVEVIKEIVSKAEPFAIHTVAPEIVGMDIDGKKFKLSDYRGKVVVLDFWGNW